MLFIWYTDIYHIFKNGQKLNAFIENNKMYNINVKHKKMQIFLFLYYRTKYYQYSPSLFMLTKMNIQNIPPVWNILVISSDK